MILSAAKQFRDGMLGSQSSKFACREVCLALQVHLSIAYGLVSEVVQGTVDLGSYDMYHTWLKLPDGRILDPTADQFDELELPSVYIGPLPSSYTEQQ